MTMELKMQSLMDSLCRCFGSPIDAGDISRFDPNNPNGQQYASPSQQRATSSTPDAKRRTKTMKLQEEQWDALFDCNAASNAAAAQCGPLNGAGGFKSGKPPTAPRKEDMTVEQAQAVAKAKLAANGGGGSASNTPVQSSTRRKRALPEDIFRSKKNNTNQGFASGGPNNNSQRSTNDAFSRFLTNNPVLANSLCFATPVRDSTEEADPSSSPREGIKDCNSVVSDANASLNTAEDTITSTLYYEQVKLAGLKQKNPPMPLFGAYEVKENDDIRKVAASDSYSSSMMKAWVRQNPEMLKVEPMESEALKKSLRNGSVGKKNQAQDDDIPPDMVNSSSDSTGRSV